MRLRCPICWSTTNSRRGYSLADAGAHSSIFQDGCTPSHLLTHWARDRTRGPKLPLELVVKKQSHEIAQLFGLLDRGQIKPGLRADINVIDWDNLTLHKPFSEFLPLLAQNISLS